MAPVAPGRFFVGDVVKLDDTVGKKYGRQQGVVTKAWLDDRGASTKQVGSDGRGFAVWRAGGCQERQAGLGGGRTAAPEVPSSSSHEFKR